MKSWGRGTSYSPATGRKDVIRFVEEQLGVEEVQRLYKTKVKGSKTNLAAELVTANDELYGQDRRNTIRNLFKNAGISTVFKNVSRYSFG